LSEINVHTLDVQHLCDGLLVVQHESEGVRKIADFILGLWRAVMTNASITSTAQAPSPQLLELLKMKAVRDRLDH